MTDPNLGRWELEMRRQDLIEQAGRETIFNNRSTMIVRWGHHQPPCNACRMRSGFIWIPSNGWNCLSCGDIGGFAPPTVDELRVGYGRIDTSALRQSVLDGLKINIFDPLGEKH